MRGMRAIQRIAIGAEGSEIAEAAVVLPIVFMLLFGMYWLGRAYNIYATINHAAREATRAAVSPSCATCGNQPLTADEIADKVSSSLLASKLDPTQVAPVGATLNSCSGGNSACIMPSAGKPQICVFFNAQLDTPASGPPGCGIAVGFQYPYQFYFPFTSLSLQKIQLRAEVQMRGEY